MRRNGGERRYWHDDPDAKPKLWRRIHRPVLALLVLAFGLAWPGSLPGDFSCGPHELPGIPLRLDPYGKPFTKVHPEPDRVPTVHRPAR